MKKCFVRCLIFTAFMLVLTGMPFQFLHIDLVKSAYAMPTPLPEPTTLSLLAVSAVGIGIFCFIRRRNRK